MKTHPLYLYALDPTHIGAGGYRMGRVDLTILRDAGTQLPKVPGSSINGATRSAAIYSLPEAERKLAMAYARATLDKKNKQHPHKGAEDPIARIFGYAEGDTLEWRMPGGLRRLRLQTVTPAGQAAPAPKQERPESAIPAATA